MNSKTLARSRTAVADTRREIATLEAEHRASLDEKDRNLLQRLIDRSKVKLKRQLETLEANERMMGIVSPMQQDPSQLSHAQEEKKTPAKPARGQS